MDTAEDGPVRRAPSLEQQEVRGGTKLLLAGTCTYSHPWLEIGCPARLGGTDSQRGSGGREGEGEEGAEAGSLAHLPRERRRGETDADIHRTRGPTGLLRERADSHRLAPLRHDTITGAAISPRSPFETLSSKNGRKIHIEHFSSFSAPKSCKVAVEDYHYCV